MSFDEKLRTLRLENEMTQKYVAKRIHVARSTVAGYETKNRQPSHEKLTAIASLFHVSVDYLLDGDEPISIDTSPLPSESVMEQELLKKYRKLSADSQKALLAHAHLLELYDTEQKSDPN